MTVIGAAVLAAILLYLVRTYSAHWRSVASRYAGTSRQSLIASKFPEHVVITGRAFQSYVPLTVGVHEDGLSLKLIWPLSLACPALLLPFEKVTCRQTGWFLNTRSFALRPALLDVDIVVDEKLWNWISARSPLTSSYAQEAMEAASGEQRRT
ncbi:MAG TPA: hypothetical protein VEL28_00120 [Candidatus Binatia bacterium]|nr:hypothetical protein [Candidatus Binatia bacterium]